MIPVPKQQWKWRNLAKTSDLYPTNSGTTSAAVRYGGSSLALFHVPERGFYSIQQMCPHRRAFVLDHGIIGDDNKGNIYVSCPLHKRNFGLTSGEGLSDSNYKILAFDIKEENGNLMVLLPDQEVLDSVLGNEKWMVKRDTADALGRPAAGKLDLPRDKIVNEQICSQTCASPALEW